MKENILTILLITICSLVIGQNNPDNYSNNSQTIQTREINRIDKFDTVIFNMAKAVRMNNFIDIPVSIKVDDDINALDFALKYNPANLKFHSIINHTGYISVNEYYNPLDSTLRVTSNSLTRYEKDTIRLISIRFEIFSDRIFVTDINSIVAYLNGESCSYRVVDPKGIIIGNNDLDQNILAAVYPNPATDIITVEVSENVSITLLDLCGKKSYYANKIYANQAHQITVHNIPRGIYLISLSNGNMTEAIKVLINK